MYRLLRQIVGERSNRRPGLAGDVAQPIPVRSVGDVRSELSHHIVAIAQVPLQNPVQARMAEVGQRATDPAGDVPQSGDGGR